MSREMWSAEYDNGYVVIDQEGDLVAIGMATAEQTNLIAAAPDLLAALDDVTMALLCLANMQEEAGDIVGSSETHGKRRAALAAIAKAEGSPASDEMGTERSEVT